MNRSMYRRFIEFFWEVDLNEDDVSAEQPLAQEDAWFPRAYEDERRPSRPEEKARKGQKEIVCISTR